MERTIFGLAAALWLSAAPTAAAQEATDTAVRHGIALVDEGEYDAAILSLDTAARRLAARTPRPADLGIAYVYLGVAYLAKGHETSARARFREALAELRDLKLSPERFAPRVIEVFEKARAEASTPPSASPAPPRRGGGRKALVLLGLGGAAAAGVAVAVGGGGSEAATPGAFAGPGTESFAGRLGASAEAASVNVGPFAAGPCRADLSWSEGRTEVRMFVNDAATSLSVSETRRTGASTSTADWACTAGGRYRIDLFLQEPRLDVAYDVRVSHP